MLIEYTHGGRRRNVSRRDAEILVKLGRARLVGQEKSATQYDTRQITEYSRSDMQAEQPPKPDDIQTLRADYESLYGKRPYMGWDAAKLQEKINEALEE